MKIGIITILKVNNYGAELQAYATQKLLKNLGHDAEIIDYLFYKNREHVPTLSSRPIFKFGFRKIVAEKIYPILMRFREGRSSSSSIRYKNFADFHNKYTSLSPTYKSMDELYRGAGQYDVYISGSDQIWNPGIYSSLKPYFLDFAPVGRKRIAFGSSFGVSSIPGYSKNVYRMFLSKFNAIGVREKTGVEIVKDLGLKATNVLDPTLLLNKEDWMSVSSPIVGIPQKYVLVYELTPSGYLISVAERVAKLLNVPIVRLCKSAAVEDGSCINVTDAGPSEFLYLFYNASFVVTNSFHGTAFSINFEKPFFVITPRRKNNNSRQISLLSLFGLSDRILQEDSPVPAIIDMDFSCVVERLESERKKSVEFLEEAING